MFLDSNYKVPSGNSNYMRFQDGANRFRILSSAIVGYQYWNEDNKPVRQREKFTFIPDDIKVEKDGGVNIKHFWAFVVYDYSDKGIKILEIIQATIQRAMKIKIDNRGGDAKGYDFIITKEGSGMATDYDIDVADPAPLDPEIIKQYESKQIDLEALYSGGDPFLPKAKPMDEATKKMIDSIPL